MAAILDLELDLPLADTPASRFLAWIAAGLVGLAVLALALAAMADGTARRTPRTRSRSPWPCRSEPSSP